MPSDVLYNLTVAFSLATGSAAGLLSLLTWETLRRSPFGRAAFVLSVVMVLFIIYHVLLIVSPTVPPSAHIFKSVLFTGMTAFIWTLVWSQQRLKSAPSRQETQ